MSLESVISMPATFGMKLRSFMKEHGPVCVGIDPHSALLAQWGLPDSPDGLRKFSFTVLEAVTGEVCAIKPQSAFFERHGSRGIAVLEELLAACRDRNVLSVLDVKRGDIGSTMQGYAEAYLLPGAPLEADSITLSPYLGFGSLRAATSLACENSKGVFILGLTSNAEGVDVQHAETHAGISVAKMVVSEVTEANTRQMLKCGSDLGSLGLVIGATIGSAARDLGIDLYASGAPLLAPGFGAQGAGAAEVKEVFGDARGNVLASVSRSVLQAGPELSKIRDAAKKVSNEIANAVSI